MAGAAGSSSGSQRHAGPFGLAGGGDDGSWRATAELYSVLTTSAGHARASTRA